MGEQDEFIPISEIDTLEAAGVRGSPVRGRRSRVRARGTALPAAETRRTRGRRPSRSLPMPTESYDVAIVGCGPVGMILASLLANDGLSVVAFEREEEIGYRPRARHLDAEAMRVLQTIGVADAAAPEMHLLGGLRLVDAQGRTLLEQTADTTTAGAQGWIDDYQMFQPLLLSHLAGRLKELDRVVVRTNHEVVSLDERIDDVLVEVYDRTESTNIEVSARYVIGCDGANSWVRREIGAEFERLGPDHPYLVIDATPLRADFELPEPVFSVNVCDPVRPHYVSPGSGAVPLRFEFMVMPGEDHERLTSEDSLHELTKPFLNEGDVRFDRASVYVFHSLLVDRWRVGRVLLAGDSAHVQPPFMGQGLRSGFRDASNLAWKLAMVCQGRAGEELLDSYQAERSPHARAWIDEANRIGAIVMTTDRETARRRDEQLLHGGWKELRPITPILGHGLHGDDEPPAGTLAPQPILPDGRRMDELVGHRFLVVARPELVEGLPEAVRLVLDGSPDVVLTDGDAPAASRLESPSASRPAISTATASTTSTGATWTRGQRCGSTTSGGSRSSRRLAAANPAPRATPESRQRRRRPPATLTRRILLPPRRKPRQRPPCPANPDRAPPLLAPPASRQPSRRS